MSTNTFLKSVAFTLILWFSITTVSAQVTQKIGGNPYSIDPKAVLELESTTKGFLLPRMTAVQMAAITTPAEGMMVYCTDCGVGADGELRIAYNSVWQTFKGNLTGNITGNAATVTTNSNLTGPITSVGNTTAVASQTGTGSKFVMDTAPTLVTPVLGVATATSVNGTTIPSSKTLVVTTDKLSALSATTSAELAGVISDETGTGTVVLSVSPALTGTPTAPTALATDSSTQIATTAFVKAAASSSNFVDLTTAQTVAGVKTFSVDAIVNGITIGKGNGTGGANTALGNQALNANTASGGNTAIGSQALDSNTTGLNNTATGNAALSNHTTGSRNTSFGYNSGLGITTADNNTAIGASADITGVGTTNATAIGYGAVATANNTIQLGNTSVTNVKTSGTLTADAVTYPKAHGTSGQVLSTTGSGTLTWTTPSTTATAYSGILPVANGGTGSSTQNFVDLTTAQTIAGVKTFSADAIVNGITVGRGLGSQSYNTAVGNMSLKSNTTGNLNSAYGTNSLIFNTEGGNNTAIGANALYKNTTGSSNTAIGVKAINENTIGAGNVAIGLETIYSNISGNNNAAVGNGAMWANTTGSSNSAYGNGAMSKNTTGASNTAIGYQSLFEGTTNLNNTAIGQEALKNQNASRNTAVGWQAGLGIIGGDNNTVIGATANITNSSANATAIGYGAVATANNTVQLGNASVTNVKTSGTLTANAVTYPNAHGTSGQVLSTTGSGTLTWTTPSTTATAYSGILPVANGGTGSSTQNFVDLTTDQTIGGVKTFSKDAIVNGIIVGRGAGNIVSNTANGANALISNTTGYANTANGKQALQSNTTGSFNTANGAEALKANTTGANNTANGAGALINNISGANNTAIGSSTLYYNTIGNSNTANGDGALANNVNGNDNTANGRGSLYSNSSGSDNTAVGKSTLYNNTTGVDNTAVGSEALNMNTTGRDNTANGRYSLFYNTTGSNNTATGTNSLAQNTSGTGNTGIGAYALRLNNVGYSNTATGFHSLYTNSSGYENTGGGRESLYSNTTGFQNTAYGFYSLASNTTGSQNTGIGYGANVSVGNLINATAIGNSAIVSASNTVQLGNTSVTNVKTSGTLTADAVTYPNAHGTSGQVLSTTGSGTLTWTTPSTTATAYSGILPVANGGTGVTTSTGTGNVVLSNSPTFVTPTLGAASASSISLAGSDSGTTTLVANAIAGNSTLILPNDGTLATIGGAEDLTNKTINGVTPTAGIEGFTLAGGTTTSKLLTVSGNATVSGINSGDQTITLTGDVTGSGTGSFSTTLSNSGVTAATYGSSTTVPVFAVDAKGRVTSVTNTTISGASPIGSALTSAQIIVGNGSNLAAAVAMSGDVTINNAGETTIGAGKVSNTMLAGGIDLTTKVTGVLPVANGGTGGSTAAVARTNLGLGTAAVLNTGTSPGNIPVLDGNGKILNSLINVSGLTYKGSLALTVTGVAVPYETAGNYYIISDAGKESNTGLSFDVGDWMIASTSGATTTWQKISQTSTVASVAGKTGTVTLATSDLTDVDLAGNATGKVLTWNGTKWAPANVSAGTITSVTAASPLVSSGGATPQISMPVATTSANGYLSSTDWTTFNNKAAVASPTFTGVPAAPTASAGTNTTQIATTAFVTTALSTAGVRDVTDEFPATVSQTVFTLTQTKSANSKVKMYINGVRISNTAYSVSGTTLTYVPANNSAYTLTAGDRIQFDYFY